MTATGDLRRARTGRWAAFFAVLMVSLAASALWRDSLARRVDAVSGPVFPGWPEQLARAGVIMVTTADDSFHILREEDGWRLPERGAHPVSTDMLARLDRSLTELTYRARKTADPERLDRLGLGDPYERGRGALLDIASVHGEPLVSVIFGDPRPGGGVYLRFPGAAQSYVADAAPPPLTRPADWLDLAVLQLTREEIASASVEPAEGPAYELTRPEPAEPDFALGEPAEGWTLMTRGAGNLIARAAVSLAFQDVRLASELTGEPVARHVTRTFDGLEVTLAVHEDGADSWVVASAASVDETAALAAADLNARVQGWAYRLPPFTAERLSRSLVDIAETAEDAPPQGG
ncbi:MAG: DUF4340 domain-containing protein [Caulobacterales bacterium]|nr:DUF4340 domain-containing protein [Caulobacterales bacterium]